MKFRTWSSVNAVTLLATLAMQVSLSISAAVDQSVSHARPAIAE
jgi:hypothetical protein